MSQRHLFLTGQPGVGKSTLCERVLHDIRQGWQCLGFYTAEVRDASGQRCGFDIITLDGSRGPLARVGKGRGPTVGNYIVDVDSFERLALPVLSAPDSTHLLLIDEVGKMELFSRRFFSGVRAALDSGNLVVFGTIPTPRYGRVIPEVAEVSERADVEVVNVTKANRDGLVAEVRAKLLERLRALPCGAARSPPPRGVAPGRAAAAAPAQASTPQPGSGGQQCAVGGTSGPLGSGDGRLDPATGPAVAAAGAAGVATGEEAGKAALAALRPTRARPWSGMAGAGGALAGVAAKRPAPAGAAAGRGWAQPGGLAAGVAYVGGGAGRGRGASSSLRPVVESSGTSGSDGSAAAAATAAAEAAAATAASTALAGAGVRTRASVASGSMEPRHAPAGPGGSTVSQPAAPRPCGPLVGQDCDPRVLLLGLTASPIPEDPDMAYSERSMWAVLDELTGLAGRGKAPASGAADEVPYPQRAAAAMQLGLCFWDVLSDVHVRGGPGRTTCKANDLPNFLAKHPSIGTVACNGKQTTEILLLHFPQLRNSHRIVTLPSSSRGNTQSFKAKVDAWRTQLLL